jgi:hypothetical protein
MFATGMWGCAGADSTIRGRAAADLRCPSKYVEVTPADTSKPDNYGSGTYFAEGCRQIRRYTVQCDNAGCHDVQSFDISTLIENQAVIDLRCDIDSLVTVRLGVDHYGVAGCNLQATYRIRCEGNHCRLTHRSLPVPSS